MSLVDNTKSHWRTVLESACKRSTVVAVAARLGVNDNVVRHWLAEERSPQVRMQRRIVAVLTAPPAPVPAPAPSSPVGTNRDRLVNIVTRLEEQCRAAERDPGTPRNHYAALTNALRAAVRDLSAHDGDLEITASAIVRSRAWREEVAPALERVFEKYQGAAREFLDALGDA